MSSRTERETSPEGPIEYIRLTRERYQRHGYAEYRWVANPEASALVVPNKPLSESRVAVVVSGGAYVAGQVAFHYKDDSSLRAIPKSYYEAARIDGVSTWTVLWEITLPLLKPTIVFIVVFSSIGFLRIFDHVYNMTTQNPGGPLNSTKPLVLMIYQTAFSSFDMGYAAAQTVVLFLVLLVVSLLQLRILRDR